ncbi:ABC transporter permease [Bdellovibrionota bacterium FG-2]
MYLFESLIEGPIARLKAFIRAHEKEVDFFCLGKKFLVYNLVSRNLKIKYRRSVFGVFWTLLAPIGTALVYYFVFKVIMAVRIPQYPLFILTGVLFWTFFAQTVMESMESLVGNWGLISKVPIPLQIFPFTGALTNLINLLIALPVLIGVAFASGVVPGWSFLLLPFYAFCLFLMAYGFGFILAVAFVYFRDLRHLMGIVIQIWFYSTPVVYAEDMIPVKYRWVLSLNPLGKTFEGLHGIVSGRVDIADLGLSLSWGVAVMLAAVALNRVMEKGVVERI